MYTIKGRNSEIYFYKNPTPYLSFEGVIAFSYLNSFFTLFTVFTK